LRRSGAVLRSEEKASAEEALRFVTDLWQSCVSATLPEIQLEELQWSALVHLFGSCPLGRRSDLDVCLLAPNAFSMWDWIMKFSDTLKMHGIHHIYAAHSDRCPRLKLRLHFDKTGPLDLDMIIACAPTRSLKLVSSGEYSLSDLMSTFVPTDPSRVSLSGPLFLNDVLSRFERKLVLNDVACLIDFTKMSLVANNLAGLIVSFLSGFG
jgi:hypothetical protein